jgi:hypothetical protein
MVALLVDIAIIAGGCLVGAFVSMKLGYATMLHVRNTAWAESERSEAEPELHVAIFHIRDDLVSIHTIFVLTNGLLAGVLVALILNLAAH